MTQPYPSDLAKEYVLSVYPSAKPVFNSPFVTIMFVNTQLGTGISEAAAWHAAKYYIMSQQIRNEL